MSRPYRAHCGNREQPATNSLNESCPVAAWVTANPRASWLWSITLSATMAPTRSGYISAYCWAINVPYDIPRKFSSVSPTAARIASMSWITWIVST